jgi:NADPH-dependent curcumin reductase CurA
MQGFLVFNHEFGPAYTEEHQRNVQKWLAEGSMAAKLSITEGIDNAPEGFIGMLQGKNFGKAVLKIKDA